MSRFASVLLQAALVATPLVSVAQQWGEDNDVQRDARAPRIFWDGQCRVTQHVEADGEIVERRRCQGDGAAHARAARGAADDRDAPRFESNQQARRYDDRRDEGRRDDRYAEDTQARPRDSQARMQRRQEDNSPAPVLLAPRIIAQAIPVAAPASKVAIAPRPAKKSTSAIPFAPRIGAPAATPGNLAAWTKSPAPMSKAQKSARAPQPLPKLAVKAKPNPVATVPAKAGRANAALPPLTVKPQIPEKRLAARSALQPQLVSNAAVLPKPPVGVAKVQAPVVVPRVNPNVVVAGVPVEQPREAAKTGAAAAPVIKTTASGQKSEWLVLLPGEAAKEKVETKVEQDNLDNSAPVIQSRVHAKGENYLKSTAYREYVMRKGSDPYSNLK